MPKQVVHMALTEFPTVDCLLDGRATSSKTGSYNNFPNITHTLESIQKLMAGWVNFTLE
jgi:hypothetical protein